MTKRTLSLVGLVGLVCFAGGCATYTGVSKADGQIYISGMTSYFIFSTPWIRRCDLEGTQLHCVELTEDKPARERERDKGDDAQPASASSAAPAGAPASDAKKPTK